VTQSAARRAVVSARSGVACAPARAPYNHAIDEKRRHAQIAALDDLLQRVQQTNAFQRGRLRGASVSTLADVRALPFTTKDELLDDQAATPPYGTNLTFGLESYTHLHLTSGTVGERLRVLQTAEDWQATRRCFALVLREAGITAADRVALPFPFGAYLQFWAAAAGVEDVGALALPLGGLEGRERLRAIAEFEATAIVCTPTYALGLIDVALEWGLEDAFASVRAVVCQGEPGASIPAARERIESAWRAARQRARVPVRDPRPLQRRGGRRGDAGRAGADRALARRLSGDPLSQRRRG
jgi:phenylacetate-CoA ligase